jgi:hypothetical protein
MKTWKLPEPPASWVDELIDRDGRVYTRLTEDGMYWYSDALGSGRGTYHWTDLLWQRGPLTGDE